MENKIIIAETERLILRRYAKEDVQDLFEYLSDKEVVKYEPYKPLTLDETKENLRWRIRTDEMIAVELKNSHKMIGNVYMGKRDFEALERPTASTISALWIPAFLSSIATAAIVRSIAVSSEILSSVRAALPSPTLKYFPS